MKTIGSYVDTELMKNNEKSRGLTAGISKKSRNSWCGKILGQASLKGVTFYNNMLLMIKKTYVSKNEIIVLVVAIMSDYIAMYMYICVITDEEALSQLSFILYVHSDSYYMFISLSFLNITSFKKVIFVIEHVRWWFLVGCFFTVSKTCLESSLAWIWFYFYNTSNYMNDIVKITTKVCQRCDVYSQGHRVSESCIDRKIQVISQELCNGRHGPEERISNLEGGNGIITQRS